MAKFLEANCSVWTFETIRFFPLLRNRHFLRRNVSFVPQQKQSTLYANLIAVVQPNSSPRISSAPQNFTALGTRINLINTNQFENKDTSFPALRPLVSSDPNSGQIQSSLHRLIFADFRIQDTAHPAG
jgi:hypothetical protein